MWKNVAGLIKHCFTSAIKLHDTLNGFWVDHRTRNSFPEDKTLQKLTSMREEVLYKILLNL